MKSWIKTGTLLSFISCIVIILFSIINHTDGSQWWLSFLMCFAFIGQFYSLSHWWFESK